MHRGARVPFREPNGQLEVPGAAGGVAEVQGWREPEVVGGGANPRQLKIRFGDAVLMHAGDSPTLRLHCDMVRQQWQRKLDRVAFRERPLDDDLMAPGLNLLSYHPSIRIFIT